MLNQTAPYAVELDGLLSICRRGDIEPLEDLRGIDGDCRVVSDLQGAVARTMTVEADQRYVELMISKKFQETGEFDEPVTVITHWKKKQTRNSTDVFFTALPTRRYYQYLELVKEHKNHLVVLPLQAVLLAIHRRMGRGGPSAVVFQHDRFADVIVGTRTRVWYANRVVAFDTSSEQIQNLWDSIRSDIQAVGRDHHQSIPKIHVVTWMTSQPVPQWSGPDDPELVLLDAPSVLGEDQSKAASLPALIHAGSAREAIAPPMEKVCYGAKRVLPIVNLLCLVLALACAAGGFWYQRQIAGLQQQVATLRQNAMQIKDRAAVSITPANYKPVQEFLEQLWSARSLPGYSQLLRDFSAGSGSELQLEVFKADYAGSQVQIEAFGKARAPFEASYKAYQGLQQHLLRRGYTILEERFDTRIDRSDFMIRLVKELQ